MAADRISRTDDVLTYILDRPAPAGVNLRRLNLAVKNDPTLGARPVGYLGLTGGSNEVSFMFAIEPSRGTIQALDAFLDNIPALPPLPPTNKDLYGQLVTDSDRLAFIASMLGLT